MSTASQLSDLIQSAFRPTPRGVVGLVDHLLRLCREQRLELHWQLDRCRVHPIGRGPEEVIDVPLGNSVFRAILARIAALCNERVPNSVSPYGGKGELAVGASPSTVFRVVFANTPSEQRLELTPVRDVEEVVGELARPDGKRDDKTDPPEPNR